MFSWFKEEKVQYFGLWAEEGMDDKKALAALDVLAVAVRDCVDRDVRSEEVEAVLAWIEQRSRKKHPVTCFRDAMVIHDPVARKAALTNAYVRVLRALGLYNGRL